MGKLNAIRVCVFEVGSLLGVAQIFLLHLLKLAKEIMDEIRKQD